MFKYTLKDEDGRSLIYKRWVFKLEELQNIIIKPSIACVWLFTAPWTIACQAPLSIELSKQEYWSGLSFPSPESLPSPVVGPWSPALQADSLPSSY